MKIFTPSENVKSKIAEWALPIYLFASRQAAKIITNYILHQKKFVCTPGIESSAQEAVSTWSLTRYYILVFDKLRMQAYKEAIRKQVKGKIVLEIGVGALAPLARMAVDSGARKVYAIEANHQSARFAKRMIQRDGLDDKIEILEGFSQDISLKEKADVLVHEIIGYMGSDEGMAPAVSDAKERLLKPGANLIPLGCKVQCAPIPPINTSARSLLIKIYERLFYNVRKKENRYHVWNYPKTDLLCEPQVYENKDFTGEIALKEESTLRFEMKRTGKFGGFLFWNNIEVSDENDIDCFQGTTWGCVYIPFYEGQSEIKPGDQIVLNCYQDLTHSPRYRFSASLVRDNQIKDLGERKICW